MKLILVLALMGGCQCGVTKVCTGETCSMPETKQTEPMDIPPKLLPGRVPWVTTPGSGGWW